MKFSSEEDEVYSFAMHHNLYNSAGFAITYADRHDDKEELATAARKWQERHLRERKEHLEEEMQDLKSRIQIIDNDMERNETAGYGT